ncbi:MAG: PTS sugar transporter subunit IIA [Gammaproteobacteria bacterium]
MSVGLLLITHANLGKVLLDTAKVATKISPPAIDVIEADWNCDPEKIFDQSLIAVKKLNTGHGVLVLTDLYGATPNNIATRILTTPDLRIITGLNLPMLIKILNYSECDLDMLVEKALEGGSAGVIEVT